MTWSAATLEGKPLMQSTISQGRLRRVRHAPLSISPLCWRDPPPRVHREADVGAALAALAQGSEQVAAEEPAAGAGAATPDRRGRSLSLGRRALAFRAAIRSVHLPPLEARLSSSSTSTLPYLPCLLAVDPHTVGGVRLLWKKKQGKRQQGKR